MFAVVKVDNSIDLPHFPEELNMDGMSWQSKQGLDRYGGPYRITADGRLEEKKVSYRDKTDEEKEGEAEKWGFDSWKEMERSYDEADAGSLYPDEIDYEYDTDEDTPPTWPSERTTDEIWWADISHHGCFEFHQIIREDPIEFEKTEGPNGTIERPSEYALDVFLQYEARFTKGGLDEIVFQGSRAGNTDDPIGNALNEIEEWREWKEEQDDA